MSVVKVKDVAAAVERFAPLNLQDDFDNCGLICGDPESIVSGVLVTVDTTLDVVREAIKNGCNMIIEHHPSIFYPLKKLDAKLPSVKALTLALKNDVAVYAAHTNVDYTAGGLNDRVAALIGLTNVTTVTESYKSARIGTLNEKITAGEYAARLGKILNDGNVAVIGDAGRIVTKAAVINGGGGSESALLTSADAGADIFISGDIKYSLARLAKELNHVIISIGHFESEAEFTRLMQDVLRKEIPILKVMQSKECVSPYCKKE